MRSGCRFGKGKGIALYLDGRWDLKEGWKAWKEWKAWKVWFGPH